MTLEKLPDGSVRLGRINEWQLRALHHIPAAADPEGDAAALARLFPAPYAPGEASPEQQEDWAEFVQPDLEATFTRSIASVARDLKNVELQRSGEADEDEDDKPHRAKETGAGDDDTPEEPPAADILHTFVIPAAHVEDWFRAMNQARLMLAAKYQVHRTDPEHLAQLFAGGKAEVFVYYDLLSALCGWWVEALMRGNNP